MHAGSSDCIHAMLPLEHLLCMMPEASSASPALRQAVHVAAMMDATLDVACLSEASPSRLREALDAVRSLVDRPVQTGWVGSFAPSDRQEDAVPEYIADRNVDLIVTAGRTARALSPSTLSSFIGSLSCSVLVSPRSVPPSALERLLVPTDFSAPAQTALNCAIHLASAGNASISLLHVIETTPYVALTPVDRLSLGRPSVAEYRAERRLTTVLNEASSADVPVTTHIEYGAPAHQIPHFIDHNDIDLTVMAPESTPSPVSERLLQQASGPVLFV